MSFHTKRLYLSNQIVRLKIFGPSQKKNCSSNSPARVGIDELTQAAPVNSTYCPFLFKQVFPPSKPWLLWILFLVVYFCFFLVSLITLPSLYSLVFLFLLLNLFQLSVCSSNVLFSNMLLRWINVLGLGSRDRFPRPFVTHREKRLLSLFSLCGNRFFTFSQ